MHFILLPLTFLICNQALALPATSVEASELQTRPIYSVEIPHEITIPQPSDSRSTSHFEIVAGHDTSSLQIRVLPWTSTGLNAKLRILLPTAVATALQMANAWLSWKFSLFYNQNMNNQFSFTGTLYADNGESTNDLSFCINKFEPNLYGNTGGTLWVQGDLALEGTWKDRSTGNLVTVFWTATCRFYLATKSGTPLISNIVQMVYYPTGYNIINGLSWACRSIPSDGNPPPGGGPSIHFPDSTFNTWS